MTTAPTQYTRTAIALHWLIALLIFIAFPVGLYMVDLPLSPQKLKIISWHKWAGITVLALVLVRILWRATHRPPALPDSMSGIEKLAAHGAHHLLYLLMIAVPMAGWLMSSAKGFPVVWFGVLPLPDLIGKSESLAEFFEEAHEILAWLMALIVVAHAAAAVKHHFAARDGVLARMLPFLK
ncbi:MULTISPECIES: cytochrome b [Niveibacterium]|uniref:Cytochrome b n=1 Tax=Niveibacterium microcysteis TaxID=2811415 RepID=A0ABX7M4L3_9RHOO|nr:cytochrome b [Niveibacterium microcysteis]QSI76686.1 cytochrome b [Niveibacterium microcysteis]